jgi:O-antigen ligase
MTDHHATRASNTPPTWSERVLLAGVFLLPLVCWPGLDRPFSTPKVWLLAGLALVVLLGAVSDHLEAGCPAATRPRALDAIGWPILAWLAALGLSAAVAPFPSLDALLVAVLPVPVFLAIRAGHLDARRLVRAIVWASVLQSAIAVLQWAGFDPLRVPGWIPDVSGAARMRVYGTFGNPNFVAAWLCATLPLVVPRSARRAVLAAAASVLQVAAILATGSRVVLLSLPVVLAVMVLARVRPRTWWLAALPIAASVLWLSPARPLGDTIEGRYYLARVTAAHLAEVPIAGKGPGAFVAAFAGWQVQWLRQHGTEPAARRFAGPIDHAHNDYLEFWVEYGPVGFVSFLVLSGWLVKRSWPPRAWTQVVALAGAASLSVTALVDFPFHRPAEWALGWMLLAVAGSAAVPGAGPANHGESGGEPLCP